MNALFFKSLEESIDFAPVDFRLNSGACVPVFNAIVNKTKV